MLNKFKERKQLKEEARQDAIKQQEIESRLSIRKTLNSMKNQVGKFDKFKDEYIEKARKAKAINNTQNYNLAKRGLKLCLSKQRFLEGMISSFEITFEIAEMNKIVNEFVGGMNILSESLQKVTSNIDISKAQLAYEKALAKNNSQYAALDAFLKEASDSLDTFEDTNDTVSDQEVDNLISSEVINSESTVDDEIDSQIESIKQHLNAN